MYLFQLFLFLASFFFVENLSRVTRRIFRLSAIPASFHENRKLVIFEIQVLKQQTFLVAFGGEKISRLEKFNVLVSVAESFKPKQKKNQQNLQRKEASRVWSFLSNSRKKIFTFSLKIIKLSLVNEETIGWLRTTRIKLKVN